ncbi:MAG: TlpA disulfide reductase family protein [Candidatus Competibacteraceae bacterium]|jgi:peroxiredoxin|nr:TlpA disulfide reductase family protein [Candidatus Competibacteraceae bacterium]
MRRRVILGAGLIGVLLIAGGAISVLMPAEVAPKLTVYTLDGRAIQLTSLQGKPVLVTFWATTCPACVQEIPHLTALYSELHPQGLEIVGIAMAYDPPNYVLQMVEHRRIPYPIALDPLGEAAQAFGDVRLTPTSFLISPQGRIVEQHVGAWDQAALRESIRSML